VQTDHGFHNSPALPLALLLLSACANPATAPDTPAAVMVGEWRYARAATAHDAPSLNAGFFVTIAIDSAAEMRFWGRVTAWFVGDVGLSPDRFGPVSGAVDLEHGVTLLISAKASGTSAVTVMGEVDGDVILVHECWAGANVGPFSVGGRFQRLP
jgi:hypothetical protein